MLNLDTHILLFALDGQLTQRERVLLRGEAWGISAMVLWEIGKLANLGKILRGLDDAVLSAAIARLRIWPVDAAVAREAARLDFRGDPADGLIAATSIVTGVPLLTRDRRILQSRLVPFAQ
jgi:PIN domain nuclease of toxin-antitoxin system